MEKHECTMQKVPITPATCMACDAPLDPEYCAVCSPWADTFCSHECENDYYNADEN